MTAEVKNCSVQECYYNTSEVCHAGAILVGSGHPVCDTFITQYNQHATPSPIARVSECQESDCKYNLDLNCNAPSINVDYHERHADCVTYEAMPTLERDIDVPLLDETVDTVFEGSTNPRAVEEREE